MTYVDPGQLALTVPPAPPPPPVPSDRLSCLSSPHHGVIVTARPGGEPACALCAPTNEGRPS